MLWEATQKNVKKTSHIVRAISKNLRTSVPLFHNNFSHFLNSKIDHYYESVSEGDVPREATKKNQEKKFTTVVNYGGGVSKVLCVNLKKVLFLELDFQKTC